MSIAIRKSPRSRSTAQKHAAKKAEQAAKVLHSFATALNALDAPSPQNRRATPRNWWKLQAGRFKNDPTFPEFVAQVQAARKQEG